MYSVKQVPEEILTLDIHFQEDLTPATIATLTIELTKILLYQRRQIPDQFEVMKRQSSPSTQSNPDANNLENVATGGDAPLNPREQMKRQRAKLQQKKLEQRYLKKASAAVQLFEKIENSIQEELTSPTNMSLDTAIEEIAIVIGATPMTPKEVYRLQFPPLYWHQGVGAPKRLNPKAMQQLFKTIITHKDFFNRIGKDINVTNTYLAIKRRGPSSEQLPKNLILRPGFLSVAKKTCKVTVFNLIPPQTNSFETPMKTELARKVSYTPYPMDMCTPLSDRSNLILNSSDIEMSPLNDGSLSLSSSSSGSLCSTVVNATPVSTSKTMTAGHDMDAMLDQLTLDRRPDEINWFFVKEFFKGFRDPQVESA